LLLWLQISWPWILKFGHFGVFEIYFLLSNFREARSPTPLHIETKPGQKDCIQFTELKNSKPKK
jgi:hypothetical protein